MVSWLREPSETPERISRVLHQASFLQCSLRGRAHMRWQQAAGWLVRACRALRPETQPEEDEMEEEEPERDIDQSLAAWAMRPPEECPSCCEAPR